MAAPTKDTGSAPIANKLSSVREKFAGQRRHRSRDPRRRGISRSATAKSVSKAKNKITCRLSPFERIQVAMLIRLSFLFRLYGSDEGNRLTQSAKSTVRMRQEGRLAACALELLAELGRRPDGRSFEGAMEITQL